MDNMEILTKSAEETKNFGAKIANKLATGYRPPVAGAYVIALSGELGSGKTTFTQGFAKALGLSSRIISPTFIIMRSYYLSINHYPLSISHFYHIDLYRLGDDIKNEFENLGVFDILDNPANIVLIEWAEKAKQFLPKGTIWIKFKQMGESERKIKLVANE
jgi:tRNA threonylcarbamoyladenosine biosynthesis protein TsaE